MQQWPGQQVGPAQSQQPAQPRAPGIIQGPAPVPSPAENRQTAQNTFRPLTAEEITARGLPPGAYQVNGLGQVNKIADAPEQEQTADAPVERIARIETSLANLRRLEELVSTSDMGTGSIVGQESFRAGEDYLGFSGFINQRANDVAGSIEMVQGDLINQVRNEMQEQGAPIGARGADTEKEASRLAASIANLAQTQDEQEFLVGVQRARDYYIRRLGASFRKAREAGQDLPATDILNSLFEQGATTEELASVSTALGLEPDRETLEANVRYRDSGQQAPGFAPNDGGPPPGGGGNVMFQGIPGLEGDYSAESLKAGLAQGTGDAVQGVGDFVGIFTNPFAQTLSNVLGYEGAVQTPGTAAREAVGLPRSPEGAGRQAREFAAGAASGGLLAKGVASTLNPGVMQNALNTFGRTPIRDTAAGAGAGAGSYIGEREGGTIGAIGGLLLGGLSGYGGANALASLGTRSTPTSLAQAAARQNVDILPADAGGAVARAVTTGTRASPISVAPVASAAERQQGQFAQANRRVAAEQGEVLDTQQAGEQVRQGAANYIETSRRRGQRMYDRATQQASGVPFVIPQQSIQAARAALARVRENPAATESQISSLETFINKIEGGVTIQGLRDARTTLSEGVYNGQLRSNSEQGMWKGILGNVADDIERGLREAGKDQAADTFRMADNLWSQRIEMIDETLAPVIGRDGNKSGEQVLQAIEGMARGQSGGNARLSRILGALDPQQAGNVRATIVDRLGRATPGAQDAQGEAFSAATFLTNWNRMTPQAKASIFPDTATRNNLNDLATIAEGTKRGQSMANTSNTGVAINTANVIAGGAGAATNLPLTLLGAGSLYLTGRLMASPRFAQILARTSKMPPEAANRAFREQIGVLATREPLLQSDLARLTNAINDNGRLAAEQNQQQN